MAVIKDSDILQSVPPNPLEEPDISLHHVVTKRDEVIVTDFYELNINGTAIRLVKKDVLSIYNLILERVQWDDD